MADEQETQEAEGEQSWTDSVTEWVTETYEDVTGSSETETEEGPISVPYTEPTEDEQAAMQHQADLSELISSVCNSLQTSAEHVHHQASILRAGVESTSHDECNALAAQCSALAGEAYAAAAQLTAAGVQDWVYSVKACNEVGFWANSASGHASAAGSADTESSMGISLNSAENDLSNAVAKISGA